MPRIAVVILTACLVVARVMCGGVAGSEHVVYAHASASGDHSHDGRHGGASGHTDHWREPAVTSHPATSGLTLFHEHEPETPAHVHVHHCQSPVPQPRADVRLPKPTPVLLVVFDEPAAPAMVPQRSRPAGLDRWNTGPPGFLRSTRLRL